MLRPHNIKQPSRAFRVIRSLMTQSRSLISGIKKTSLTVIEGLQPHNDWPIPKKGLFQDYLRWATPRTEAPMAFHLASLLVAGAILLGRKCEIQVGSLTFYPVIYALSIGQSTIVRKTHSINMMRGVLNIVEAEQRLFTSLFLSDDGTPEGLLTELNGKSSGVKVINEFGAFLKRIKKRDFLAGFTSLFTELFDCPNAYTKQLSEDRFVIDEPFLCILGSTTKEWLLDAMDETDIASGFLARFLFFPGEGDTNLIPITPPQDSEMEKRLAEQLGKLHEISGTFIPTNSAEKVYSKWYIRHRDELDDPGMALLSPYYGRLEGYVWKIALIFEVTTDSESRSISTESTKLAIRFVEHLKGNLRPLIQQDLQPTTFAKKLEKVRRLIQRVGPTGITRSALLRASHLPAKELNDICSTLDEREEIEPRTELRGGRSTKVYRLKENSSP